MKILGEVLQRALNGEGGEPAQSAQRAVQQRLAQIVQHDEILDTLFAGDDAVDDLDAAGRADAARRAFAAALGRAELEREARLLRHVDAVVEHHDAAVTEHRSEEHTSELQSRLHLVCRLLLEKKKQNN